MSETSSKQTKRNRKEYYTVKTNQINSSSHVFNVKIEKFVGGNHCCNVVVVMHVGCWNLITSFRLIQVGNNRNDHFRYFFRCPPPLNRGAHRLLIQEGGKRPRAPRFAQSSRLRFTCPEGHIDTAFGLNMSLDLMVIT